jgi:predicted Zn-dependent protease
MTRRRWRAGGFAAGLAAAFALLLAGCTVNPATGRSSFTGFMSEGDEARVGAENHPKVLEEFGGTAGGPELAAYVTSIGKLLASTSERPNGPFTFTVLNSPIVNAFAVPGGYIYVTRGLLALANDEAELAGVMAHEIGHITARHSAQRYSQSVLAQIGLIGLGMATGSSALVDLAGTGAAAYLQSYSRDQEFEADTLGVRYLARATYDPKAMSAFLSSLLADSRLEATIAGNPGTADQYNIMATHPRTVDRVERAIAAANQAPIANPILARDVYLDKIDGLLYGDDPEQGFIKGRRFAHPRLKLEFTAPEGYSLHNSATAVLAQGPQGAQIVFDAAPQSYAGDMAGYIANVWAAKIRLDGMRAITIDGMEAATATAAVDTQSGPAFVRLYAIRFASGRIYRFLCVGPVNAAESFDRGFRGTAASFRRLSDAEARALKPMRIRIVTVRGGDTVASLARAMPFDDYREERFRVLNGLGPNDQLTPGQRVKLIAE